MNPMIRFFVAVISMLAIIGLVNKGYCDTLHSNYDDWRNYAHYFQFLDVSNNNGWGNAETIKIENADTDQLFRAFCIDHDTMTSPEFNNPLIGQNYDPVALNSPSMTLYTQSQKDALNSLFSHVYSTVYDFDGNIIDDASAYFYQLVVWEIIHETSGTFNISNGTFGIQAAATYIDPDNHDGGSFDDWDYYHSTVAAANSWLDAISGTITWESIGYG
ncbi:MAG: Cys-Gln thioester bond-forming surface protein, partial [Planctomycetaceae bacterium]|nr:Cys-Gln thioester bond-forming surface protein [Planctomycetaceae bacterium]